MPSGSGIASRYVDALNAADLSVMLALFAPGAVIRHPSGSYTGADAIRGFFSELVFAHAARLTRVAEVEFDGIAWLEAEAESKVTPGRQRVVDVFRLDGSGRIVDLGVYSGNIVP